MRQESTRKEKGAWEKVREKRGQKRKENCTRGVKLKKKWNHPWSFISPPPQTLENQVMYMVKIILFYAFSRPSAFSKINTRERWCRLENKVFWGGGRKNRLSSYTPFLMLIHPVWLIVPHSPLPKHWGFGEITTHQSSTFFAKAVQQSWKTPCPTSNFSLGQNRHMG